MAGGGFQTPGARRRSPEPGWRPRAAFSLVELVIVVVVFSLLAMVAIPRLNSLATTAQSNADEADITKLRQAIEIYHGEHGVYPTGLSLQRQLTQYTDAAGDTSMTKSVQYRFGPYLRKAPATYSSGIAGAVLIDKKNENAAKWLYYESDGSVVTNEKSSVGQDN